MVYMAADMPGKGFAGGAHKTLTELHETGSTGEVNVIAQADLRGLGTRRYFFRKPTDSQSGDYAESVVESLPDSNCSTRRSLVEFMEWGQRHYPADHFMVVLWGHGYGTDDYDPFPRKVLQNAPDHTLRTVALRANGAPDTVRENLLLRGDHHQVALLSCLPDWKSRTLLKNRDVGDAMRDVARDGKRADVVGFDACDMAMAEVWLEMLEGTAIGIGSEYAMPFSNWPFASILKRMQRAPGMSPREVGKATVDCFAAYYRKPGNRRSVTLSACDLDRATEMTAALKAFVDLLISVARDPRSRRGIFHARNHTLEFDPDGFIDLRNFCQLAAQNLKTKAIRAAYRRVARAIDNFIVAHKIAGTKLSRATGLSVFFPKWIEKPDFRSSTERKGRAELKKNYADVVFCRQTGWDRMLLALLEPAESVQLNSLRRENSMGREGDLGRKTKKKKSSSKKKKGSKKH